MSRFPRNLTDPFEYVVVVQRRGHLIQYRGTRLRDAMAPVKVGESFVFVRYQRGAEMVAYKKPNHQAGDIRKRT